MNPHAIEHRMNGCDCAPLSEHTLELRLRTARSDFNAVTVVYNCKYDFNRIQKRQKMRCAFHDGLYDYYIVRLTLSDVRLAYVFELRSVQNEKTYTFSEDGLTLGYDYTLSYYNCFQMAYINPADVQKGAEWMQEAVFYQIFVDRFFMAGKKDTSYVNLCWGDKPLPKSFAGGDLNGITEKLDYICGLGFNALYLTPVFCSVSNHKYDISDYARVDPQFGGNDALFTLAEAAHKKGVRLVLDAVFNHCSEHLQAFEDVRKNGRASRYSDWFCIREFGNASLEMQYECFGSCKYMPKFNNSNPAVQEFLISQAAQWTQSLELDGWRLDVSDEVSHDFWRRFRKEIRAVNPDAVIIGENWHNAESYLLGDQFDGIMNYAVTKALLDYFAYGVLDASGLAERLSALMMRNTTSANHRMLNLIDNHDTHRFLNMVDGDEEKLLAALTIIYLLPGAPCVYYGTEIAMAGGYDPDNRRCMDWKAAAKGHRAGALLVKLKSVRACAAVRGGDVRFDSRDGVFLLSRQSDDETLTLAVNFSGKAKNLVLCGGSVTVPNRGFTAVHSSEGRML